MKKYTNLRLVWRARPAIIIIIIIIIIHDDDPTAKTYRKKYTFRDVRSRLIDFEICFSNTAKTYGSAWDVIEKVEKTSGDSCGGTGTSKSMSLQIHHNSIRAFYFKKLIFEPEKAAGGHVPD